MKISKSISIIIPTYKDWDRLKICIEALENQSINYSKYEIIIINNHPGSRPDYNLFELAPNIQLIEESKPGSYAARNAGLKIAKGEIIAFTDSDCIPDKDWLLNAKKTLDNVDYIQLLGGEIIISKSEKPNIFELHDSLFAFKQNEYVRNGYSVTANLFVKKRVFDEIGGFDDSVKSSGDKYFCFKAKERGFNIGYSELAIVEHPARKSLDELKNKIKRIAGGVDKNSGYLLSNIKAIAYLRLPLKDWKVILFSEYSTSNKIKLVFLIYYLRVISVFERIKVTNGFESKR